MGIQRLAACDTAGEFIELMNIGNTPIDMTGWSFDDSSRTAGSFSIGPLASCSRRKS